MTLRALLLAGTGEARALADAVSDIPDLHVTASLAGVTRAPVALPVTTRTGGFGGAGGLRDWLVAHRTDLVINATHPFAEQMQANALEACGALDLPCLRLLRPGWPPRPGWIHAATPGDTADALPQGARVLLTIGRKDLAPFHARPDLSCVLRTIEPVPGLPPHIAPMIARPPFTPDQERATMALLGVTHLVTKNAGGPGTAKLDAADALRLTTVVLDRPPPPPGPVVATVAEAVAWLHGKVAV